MSRKPDPGLAWIVPNFALTWRDAACDWTLQPRRQDGETAVHNTGNRSFAFWLVAPAAKLESLSLEFAPHPLTGNLWAELSDVGGRILRRAFTPAAALSRGGRAPVMDLSGVIFEIGAKYQVRLSSPRRAVHMGIAILAAPMPPGGLEFHKTPQLHAERLPDYGAVEPTIDAANLLVLPRATDLAAARPVLDMLAAAFPGERFVGMDMADSATLWAAATRARAVVFANIRGGGQDYDRLCFALNRRGTLTLALDSETAPAGPVAGGALERAVKGAVEDQQRCRFILRDRPHLSLYRPEQPLEPWQGGPMLGQSGALAALQVMARDLFLPKVAVVSVLYRKAEIIEAFLGHIRDQSYPGEIVTLLVDDRSPENDALRAERFAARLETMGQDNRRVTVIRNTENSGNCQSRMNGLNAEQADIYVVMDCDCLINRDFIAAHVFEHAHPEVDVVIGPLNIEANDRDPAALVVALQDNPAAVDREAEPQDPIQKDGFLNCITRNFSIKRDVLPTDGLFDLDFAYSAKPGSGFGWEDVEMGYRLYLAGARVRFTDKAISVHATHPSSASEEAKVRGSMRNFERLFAKHPDLELAGRRWAVDTYDKIARWADREGVARDPVRERLDTRFADTLVWQAPLVSVMRGHKRRLKVLSYRWHAPHQYELYKLPHDFTLTTQVGGNGMVDAWAYEQRPLRDNVRFQPLAQIDPSSYDLAILHFDENILAPELCNGVIPSVWGGPFQWLARTDLPKAAICHGTPQFLGQYGADPGRKTDFVLHEDERARLVNYLKAAKAKVVCNSHQAHAEWGFADSRVIWHGFDPQEFPQGRGDLDILALGADANRPHYRGAWEQMEVEALLDPSIKLETARHFGGDLEIRGSNAYASARFRAYAERIGRFKAYLNTTLRSPMPRSRGEAMMTGAAPVCLNNHDVALFVEPGVNGFYADEPAELADFLNRLCRDETLSRRVSAAARRTAMDVFNHDRYLTAWQSLLDELTS